MDEGVHIFRMEHYNHHHVKINWNETTQSCAGYIKELNRLNYL